MDTLNTGDAAGDHQFKTSVWRMKQDILRNERKKKRHRNRIKKDLSIPLAIILRLRVRLSLCRDELHYGTALGDKL